MNTKIKIGDRLVPTPIDDAGKAALPDKDFRDAWSLEGNAIVIDMEAAREIARDRIREARKPLFEKEDVRFMRSLAGSIQAAQGPINERQQLLREATADSRILEAKTPEELKAAMEAIIAEMEARSA